MDTSDQIVYGACWVVLALYIVTTLFVFIRGSCIGCAASFLCACVLSFDMALFNAWFLMPAFAYHIREIDVEHAECCLESIRLILTGDAARDVYLVMLGSFGSWLAVFNAVNMLKTEGCKAAGPHKHGRLGDLFVRSIYRTCGYLRLGDYNTFASPTVVETDTYPNEKELLLTVP
ncbi:hypothetical protein F4861DRAFT_467948 [Xylaria intraflava]|nr:hypothetical protein F4861DRAFT_467948 [Xylaria intraflava]